MEFDKEIIEEFVIEAAEHMESAEASLLELENLEGAAREEIINQLFRTVHSVKGSAGFIGLSTLNGLAHAMETLFSLIRDGKIIPQSEHIDALLKGLDDINNMLRDIHNSNNYDVREITLRLEALQSGGAEPADEIDDGFRALKYVLLVNSLGFNIDENDINIIDGLYNNYFLLEYDLADLSKRKAKSPLSLIRELSRSGHIIQMRAKTPEPDLRDGLSEGTYMCDVLLASSHSGETICANTGLPPEKVELLSVPDENVQKETVSTIEEDFNIEFPANNIIADDSAPEQSLPNVETATQDKNAGSADAGDSAKTRTEKTDISKTIRMNVGIVDKLMTLAGELVLVRNQFVRHVDKKDPALRTVSQRLDFVTSDLQENIMAVRMQPIGNTFGKFPRVIRELGKKLGKKIEVHITGNEVELDKAILEKLADPLTHIVRNSCDHGIETPEERTAAGKPEVGNVYIRAFHEGGQINIEIRDDGKGVNKEAVKSKALKQGLKTDDELAQMSENEIMSLLFAPGFSTAEKLSDVSGRGVGMDVVKTSIDELGGVVTIESEQGSGSTIKLRLPLTLAIIPCLIVRSGEYRYAIPQVNVDELICLYDEDVKSKIECAGDQEVYRLRDHLLPMVRLDEVFQRPEPFTEGIKSEISECYREKQEKLYGEGESEKFKQTLNFAVLKVGETHFGVIVDSVLGTEEIVVKPMHPAIKRLECYSAATVMGDGKVAIILDVLGLARHAGIETDNRSSEAGGESQADKESKKQSVLLLQSGPDEQLAVPLPMIKRIERVEMSKIESIGEKEFITIDDISTQILRLDHHLKVSPCMENEEMYLLLPNHVDKPVGILISKIMDTTTAPLDLNVDSFIDDGFLGTHIINDHITLFLDIFRIIDKARGIVAPDGIGDMSGKSARILLIEDSLFFQKLIKGYLESEGYEVVTADNGQAGMVKIKEMDCDIIVSDINMPVMDGFDFIRNVRQEGQWKDIPAIALTVVDSESSREKAKTLGFNRYELKINRNHFLKTVGDLLNSDKTAA